MRREALKYIACPSCKSALVTEEISDEQGFHIISGILRCCNCSDAYPIIHGVPRLLPSRKVQLQDLGTGEAYSTYFSKIVPEGTLSEQPLYGKTINEELQDFCIKTRIRSLHLLDGLVLLDAGCGMARIEGSLAKHCKDVVAFDITPAVEYAFETWKDLPNVHIVQGDLTSAPVFLERFDFVWCDGALPYVSDFSVALIELLKVRAPTGFLYSWSYGPEVSIVERVGRILHATRLPIRSRFFMAQVLIWFIILAGSILKRKNMFGSTRGLSEAALDFSLANKVNHVSYPQIRLLLMENHSGNNVCIEKRNRIVEFSVGLIENRGQ